jgi:hypothetical protein
VNAYKGSYLLCFCCCFRLFHDLVQTVSDTSRDGCIAYLNQGREMHKKFRQKPEKKETTLETQIDCTDNSLPF